ncbi:MAG: hypothetical protein WC789_00135 [Lentisphaeria bacterium]|jgi:hypothetical protein
MNFTSPLLPPLTTGHRHAAPPPAPAPEPAPDGSGSGGTPHPGAGTLGLLVAGLATAIPQALLLLTNALPWWWQSPWLPWIPALLTSLATWRLAPELPAPPAAKPGASGFRLRLASLAGAGLLPFLVWWRRAPHNLYLAAGAMAALLAGGWLLWEIGDAIARLTDRHREPRCHFAAILTRMLLYYTIILPIVAILLVFAAAWLLGTGTSHHDLLRYFQNIPPLLRLAGLPGLLLLPLLATRLLWRRTRPTATTGTPHAPHH